MREHGRDKAGDWYFALTQSGAPLIQPCNIFSDCFAAMAFSQYALASGDDSAKVIARETFDRIHTRKKNPKGQYAKIVPGTRPLISLALPMILANLTLELEWLLDDDTLNHTLDACLHEVFTLLYDDEVGLVREAVTPEGQPSDTFDGRLLIPGHGIEAMWFIMDIAEKRDDHALINRAVDTVLTTLDFGWDKTYGGIFYFLDSAGHPPDKLEWDQKLWWVHLEALVALAKGWRLTGRTDCQAWYEKVHDYAWRHFPDPECGEWYGYLNRQGDVSLSLKGGKWKGCFHAPRALFLCMQEFAQL